MTGALDSNYERWRSELKKVKVMRSFPVGLILLMLGLYVGSSFRVVSMIPGAEMPWLGAGIMLTLTMFWLSSLFTATFNIGQPRPPFIEASKAVLGVLIFNLLMNELAGDMPAFQDQQFVAYVLCAAILVVDIHLWLQERRIARDLRKARSQHFSSGE